MATLLLASIAHAALQPVAGPDPGIRSVAINEQQRIVLYSTDQTPLVILYPEGEEHMRIAGLRVALVAPPSKDDKKPQQDAGQCQEWCATAIGNQLTLQPMRADIPPSILVVATSRDDDPGVTHHLAFELHVRPGHVEAAHDGPTTTDDPDAYFMVNILDPGHAAKVARAQSDAKRQEAAATIATDRLKTAKIAPPNPNWNWQKTKNAACDEFGPQPNGVSDDGTMTALRFAMNTPLPIPYLGEKGEDKAEFDTMPAPGGATMMWIHAAPPKITLRHGEGDKQACALVNFGYHKNAIGSSTGTISPDVVRETVH